MKLFIK